MATSFSLEEALGQGAPAKTFSLEDALGVAPKPAPAPDRQPSLGSPMGETFGAEIMAASELPKPAPRKVYTGSVFDTVDITKLPEPEFNAEEAARLSRRAYAEQSMLAPRRPPLELKPTPKEEIDRSIGGSAMDTVIGVLQGAVSIPKGIVDNIPFDNPLSQFYKDAYEAGEKAKTGYIRSKNLERSALLERVRENQGELAASRAAFNTMFSPSGADIVAKGAGSMIAPLGLSLFNLGTKSMVAMSALANAGDAAQQAAAQLASMSPEDWSKSDIYQSLREKGLDHRDAVRILAPMYALPAQTVGAITGAVSGATGLEKALVKGGAQAAKSRLGRAGAETLGELSETLLPMVAGNAAQRLVDDRTNILKGTGQAAIETVAGALPGSALAAAVGERKPAVPTAEQMARERGFLVTPPAAPPVEAPVAPPVAEEPVAPPAPPPRRAAEAMREQQRAAEELEAAMEPPIEEGVPSGIETPEAIQAEEERPEAPPAVTPTTRTEAVEQHAVQGLPVVEAPIENIQLSEEVPQFKSDADIQGIVEPLEGKFERTGVAPIQLWRRKDGRLEVISGRHRFDLAKRSGETTIPAQIHDEAAGFDATKAATLDAELNIRDGQGKVKDYVVYFDKSGITRDEAESRGLLARPLGKRAWRIASEGSPELIAAHRADVVDDAEADAIAAAAPGNARLQAVGIKAIQSGKKAAAASNLMRAVSTLAIGREPVAEGADLFGFDESAMKEAEDMANVATRKQSELDNRLRAIQGAARRPEVAKAEGVDVKDPEAVRKRIDELKRQRSAWDNWSTNPELVNEIRRELRPEMELTAPTEAELRAEAERTVEEERRRRAEAEAPPPEEFTLTGSERAADEAAARGQRELEEAEEKTLPEVTVPGAKTNNKELALAIEDNDWGRATEQLQKSKNPLISAVGKMAENLIIGTQINWPFAETKQDKTYGKMVGAYGNGNIYIRAKKYAGNEHVVAHEAVHALTIDAIRNPTKAQQAAVNRLRNLYRYVKTRLPEQRLEVSGKALKVKMTYGLSNEEEFIAEGMSNPEFQKELAQLPYKNQTAWGAFTKAIADILGIKDQSALTELIALTEELAKPSTEGKAAPGEVVGVSIPEEEAPSEERRPTTAIGKNIYNRRPTVAWTEPDATKLDDFIYRLQDKQIDTKRVVQEIEKAVGRLEDRWNPYLQEELYHGRTATATKDFLRSEVRPLLEEMKKEGVSIGELETYLHNRFAPTRNANIAEINPNMPDGGSGIFTEDAEAYMAALTPEEKAKFERLASRVYGITQGTRDYLVGSGLEDQDTISAWEKSSPDYVPLNREDIEYSTSVGTGTGQGYSVRGPSTRRAMGSLRGVADILANVIMQRERAIVRGEKNRVAVALYGLAAQNPNPGFWLAVNPDAKGNKTKAINELIEMGLTKEDAEGLMQEPAQRIIDPQTGLVAKRINPVLRGANNVLAARINGKDRFVFFNTKDPRAERMVTALKNLDADQLGRFLTTMAAITRYFSQINTQYNPVFGIYNFLRDLQGGAIQLSGTPLEDSRAEVLSPKNLWGALNGIYSTLRAERKDQPQLMTPWSELWIDFQREGGQTGYRDMFSRAQERADALEAELKRLQESGGKKAALAVPRAILDWLTDYNETLENAVRLTAYKAALDKGLSKEQAASIAKNLTVNFNRKGQIATQAGALYSFFNSSVQGTTRLLGTLAKMEKPGDIRTLELSKIGKTVVYGGLLAGVVQAMALAAFGFDENEPPDFVKDKNFILPLGLLKNLGVEGVEGKYLAWPLPLGYHVIPALSRIITEWGISGFKDTPKRVTHIASLLLDAFNPIGNAGLSLQTIAPTILDPLVALRENEDWTGKKIYKEDFNKLDPTPGYTRAKENATWLGKQAAYYLNLISGGDKDKPGVFSPTPDQLEYFVGQVTGGAGREAGKLAKTIEAAITGEELAPYNIPLVGRFYGNTKAGYAESQRFYKNLEELNVLQNQLEGRTKRKENPQEFLKENPKVRLADAAHQVERNIRTIRKQRDELIAKGAPREQVKAKENQMTLQMKKLNDAVAKAEKKPRQEAVEQ